MCGTTPGLQRWCAGQEPCTCAGLSRGAREALIEAQLSSQCLQEPAVLFALLLQECHRVLQPAEGTQRQPCHAAPLAPKPQCIMPRTSPVVALLQRAPLVPELSDTLLVLGKLLRQPPLLRTPLPQLCFSLPCPGAGGQESLLHSCQLWGQSTGVSPPARSGGALWDADLGSPSPTLAEVVPLEPQGPVVLPQSLVLPAQLQRRLRRLAVDIPGQACAGRPPLAVSGSLPRTGCRRLCRARPPPALPQSSPYRWPCWPRPGGVRAAPGAGRWCRWTPPGAGAGCGSPLSAPPAGLPLPQPKGQEWLCYLPHSVLAALPHSRAASCRRSGARALLVSLLPASIPLCFATWTLPDSLWLEGCADGRAP